jgi:hypothetical protein
MHRQQQRWPLRCHDMLLNVEWAWVKGPNKTERTKASRSSIQGSLVQRLQLPTPSIPSDVHQPSHCAALAMTTINALQKMNVNARIPHIQDSSCGGKMQREKRSGRAARTCYSINFWAPRLALVPIQRLLLPLHPVRPASYTRLRSSVASATLVFPRRLTSNTPNESISNAHKTCE